MPPDPSPPAICALCGGNLATPLLAQGIQPGCTHEAMTSGQVVWVLIPGPPPSERRKKALGEAFWRLLVGVGVLRAAALFPVEHAMFVALIVLGLIMLFLTAHRTSNALRVPITRRFEAVSRGAAVQAWAEVEGDGWLRGGGESRGWHDLDVSSELTPTSDHELARHPRATSFSLLRVALFALFTRGWLRVRTERIQRWSRYSAAPPTLWTSPARGLMLSVASGRDRLPWLESSLLAALAAAGATDESDAVVGGHDPYRAAAPEEATPRTWVSLGQLLRTFHRLHQAQPFHHRWLRECVQPDAAVVAPEALTLPYPDPSSPLWVLLTGSSLRRAYFESAPRKTASPTPADTPPSS